MQVELSKAQCVESWSCALLLSVLTLKPTLNCV